MEGSGSQRRPLHHRKTSSYSSFVQPSVVHLEILVENLHCPSCVSYIHTLLHESRITEELKANHATAVDVATSISTQIVAITIRLNSSEDFQAAQDSVHGYVHALIQADFKVDSASVSASNELGQRRPATVVYTAGDLPRESRFAPTPTFTAQHVDICDACRAANKNIDADNAAPPPTLQSEKGNTSTIYEEEEENGEYNTAVASVGPRTETGEGAVNRAISTPGVSPPKCPFEAGSTHNISDSVIEGGSFRKQLSGSDVVQANFCQSSPGNYLQHNRSGVIGEDDENLNYQAIPPLINALGTPSPETSDLNSFPIRQSVVASTTSQQLDQRPDIEVSEITTLTSTKSPMMDPEKGPLRVIIEPTPPTGSSTMSKWRARFMIEGMTCASCSGKVTEMLRALPYVQSAEVNLMANYAAVEFEATTRDDTQKIIDAVEDMGFGCELDEIEPIIEATPVWEAVFSIEGMTCSACSGKVVEVIRGVKGVQEADVNLMANCATVVFEGGKDEMKDKIIEAIYDLGFGVELSEIRDVSVNAFPELNNEERTLHLRVDGMFCPQCPENVMTLLRENDPAIRIDSPLTLKDPIVKITYTPQAPIFTVRTIIEDLRNINADFRVSVYHPPSIEERSKEMRRKELQRLYYRVGACFLIVIPSFMIGMVWMSFVPKTNKQRIYFEQQLWAGSVRRMDWALLFLATPVMFGIADVFHKRAIRELWSLWRPGSQVPLLRRFYKFGSMNLLVSLGVSIAYISSLALLIKAARTEYNHTGMNDNGHVSSFFDSTIFLTFFLLLGRTMETWSKARTASAVDGLTSLRPSDVSLIVNPGEEVESSNSKTSVTPISPISESSKELFPDVQKQVVRRINVDLLEAGDVIIVPHGAAPPADGRIIMGTTSFDESSLTGEAAPVHKTEGDTVYAGTINKGKSIHVKVEAVAGNSMLDHIVKVVREGQTKRAPMERIADIITGYFVPVVTLLAILTWIVWLSLGYSGAISKHWKPHGDTWATWSLEFAIAVFVIACPCGIGLAAPTALFVGTGLAAKYGILAKGGGEAFQEASGLDVLVFDKTGTLTMGDEPKVTDFELVTEGEIECYVEQNGRLFCLAGKLEEATSHPLGRAIVEHCEKHKTGTVETVEIEEVPGRGLRGVFVDGEERVQAIIGNESFMAESGVVNWTTKYQNLLQKWKSEAKSVVLLATRKVENDGTVVPFELKAIFAVADPLRPESAFVVKKLRDGGHDVWMISGDNPITAKAVARRVGIKEENVLAGVLPNEKADKIKYLQQTAPKRHRGFIARKLANALASTTSHRAIVAMVGDGINDAPALANADVGIAIGSGADIALNSAKFILLTSDLTALLTLTDLSRKVFARVFFNFFWASIYNIIMVPVAMGLFYPINQARLSPVWASAAMAGSSLSVVASSLMLKTKIRGVGFKPRVMRAEDFAKAVEEREKGNGEKMV